MAKKGNRLREFEKNHRVLDISAAQEARKKKKKEKIKEKQESASFAEDGKGASGQRKRIRWIRLAGMAVTLSFTVVVLLSILNIFELKEEEAALRKKHTELLQLKEELLMTINNVNSDEFIEQQARKELHLVKGNELIFYFPDDWKPADKDEQETQEEDKKDE